MSHLKFESMWNRMPDSLKSDVERDVKAGKYDSAMASIETWQYSHALDTLGCEELRRLASGLRVERWSRMSKDELVAAITRRTNDKKAAAK